jgi:hypothetical protein
MDERIKIQVYFSPKSGMYSAYVRVNDEQYAVTRGPAKDQVLAEANHYAMQIEFDEWGNW